MAATGHDTIYAWRCAGGRAVAGEGGRRRRPDGYDAGNWKEIGSIGSFVAAALPRSGFAILSSVGPRG